LLLGGAGERRAGHNFGDTKGEKIILHGARAGQQRHRVRMLRIDRFKPRLHRQFNSVYQILPPERAISFSSAALNHDSTGPCWMMCRFEK
jgi:hypothetical protein